MGTVVLARTIGLNEGILCELNHGVSNLEQCKERKE